MTSWLDRLATTPGLGLRFTAQPRPSDAILTAFAPILDRNAEKDRMKFTVEVQETFGIQFVTDEGFFYGADPHRLWVEFRHRLRPKPQSAAPPTLEITSQAAPFSKQLPVVATHLVEAARLYIDKGRQLERIGVIATTVVNLDDAPPGFQKLRTRVTSAWDETDGFEVSVTGMTYKDDNVRDRCVHRMIRQETTDHNLVTIVLDWQRTFTKPRLFDPSALPGALDKARADAIDYFEELAAGGLFDADGNGTST